MKKIISLILAMVMCLSLCVQTLLFKDKGMKATLLLLWMRSAGCIKAALEKGLLSSGLLLRCNWGLHVFAL